MNVFRYSTYSLATLLTLGLSAPLALAHDKGNGNNDKKAARVSQGSAQGQEERAEKKGVEGREERANRHRDNGRLGMRFRNMDRDHDRVITRKEWRGSRAEFDRLDRNHDGVLTPDELSRRR